MPKIGQYEQQRTIPGESGSAFAPIQTAGQIGGAIEQAGKSLSADAQILQAHYEKLKKQEDDNWLIGEGAKINDAFLKFRGDTEKDPQFQSGNFDGMRTKLNEFAKQNIETYRTTLKDRPDLLAKVNEHIVAHAQSTGSHFATLSASRLKANSEAVRNTDFESSLQMAAAGDVADASTNFAKTIQAQINNGSLESEAGMHLLTDAVSKFHAARISALATDNPTLAQEYLKTNKASINAATVQHFQNALKPMAEADRGSSLGKQIFDENPGKNLMELNTILEQKIKTDKISHNEAKYARGELEYWEKLQKDAKQKQKDAAERQVWDDLAKTGRISKESRRAYAEIDPEGLVKIEKYHQSMIKQNLLFDKQMQAARQDERFNQIISDIDGLRSIDINKEAATGNISWAQRNKLDDILNKIDPRKSDNFKIAMHEINKLTFDPDKNKNAALKAQYSMALASLAINDPRADFMGWVKTYVDTPTASNYVSKLLSGTSVGNLFGVPKTKEEKLAAAQKAAGITDNKATPAPTSTAGSPDREAWIKKAQAQNPAWSREQIGKKYDEKYGKGK